MGYSIKYIRFFRLVIIIKIKNERIIRIYNIYNLDY